MSEPKESAEAHRMFYKTQVHFGLYMYTMLKLSL